MMLNHAARLSYLLGRSRLRGSVVQQDAAKQAATQQWLHMGGSKGRTHLSGTIHCFDCCVMLTKSAPPPQLSSSSSGTVCRGGPTKTGMQPGATRGGGGGGAVPCEPRSTAHEGMRWPASQPTCQYRLRQAPGGAGVPAYDGAKRAAPQLPLHLCVSEGPKVGTGKL